MFGLAGRLLQLPLVPTLVAWAFFFASFQRISDAWGAPPTSTTCGDPALVGLQHVRLHDCGVGNAYFDGRDTWVALHRPTAPMPSVVAHFVDVSPDQIDAFVGGHLVAGTLDLVRTAPDVHRITALRPYPALAGAVFVGDWHADDDGAISGIRAIDSISGAMIVGGLVLMGIDAIRISIWVLLWMRGNRAR